MTGSLIASRSDGFLQEKNKKALAELRAKKWSLEAGYNQTRKSSPSYSMRPRTTFNPRAATLAFSTGDVHKAYNKVLGRSASWTMGGHPNLPVFSDTSPGPAEYKQPCTMDSFNDHPTCSKTMRTKFGCATRLGGVVKSTPGPGDYFDKDKYLSTQQTAPVFGIQSRDSFKVDYSKAGPGIGTYDPDKCTKNGLITSEKYTFGDRLDGPQPPRGSSRYINPGPPAYHPPGAGAKNNDVVKTRMPKWGFGTAQRF
eukprot:gnl/MRDRNA2_/MRDRNA2_56016_c0_seq1.p1 gnl/MRDRNA2_/MRDRNA2_56016_c0~~gnl/MRDRNA2_/MRDRNA2_56016_c0_seq1.p1  ORF type:complete len:254 (+),score=33.77 gnl/MRDRNA2_/MRDRNA2_56016_c0_seq1:44-805(+)